MSIDWRAQRHLHFKRDHLLWIVLRHFLSANLVEELSIAVVDAASDGKLAFDALFDACASGGPPAMASWVVRARPTSLPLASYLQRLIRELVWQGDYSAVPDSRNVAPEEAATMKALEAALTLSHLDLGAIGRSPDFARAAPEPLQPVVIAMVDLKGLVVHSDPSEALETIVAAATERISAPLSAVLVKHLGDLCGDADLWDAAAVLYSRAESMLSVDPDPAWRGFVKLLAGDNVAISGRSYMDYHGT